MSILNTPPHNVTRPCDRCQSIISGWESSDATAGFYDVTSPAWKQFQQNEREQYICEVCMHNDLKYADAYGALTLPNMLVHLKNNADADSQPKEDNLSQA